MLYNQSIAKNMENITNDICHKKPQTSRNFQLYALCFAGGKLLPHSGLSGGSVSRGNIMQHSKRDENRYLER